MADLEDIVQRVTIEGTDDITSAFQATASGVQNALSGLQSVVESTFTEINSKGKEVTSDFGASLSELIGVIGSVGVALTGVVAAFTAFGSAAADSAKSLSDLSSEMGTTISDASALIGALSASGASSDSLATAFKRLANSIGTDWPDIAKQIEESNDKINESNTKVDSSLLSVEETQNKLATSAERASLSIANAYQSQKEAVLNASEAQTKASQTITDDIINVAKANLNVEQAQHDVEATTIALQFAWTNAYNKMRDDALSVEDANLNVQEAQQRLRDLTSGTTDTNANRNLQIQRAQLTVTQAQQKASEAASKQSQDAAKVGLDLDQAGLNATKAQIDLDSARSKQAEAGTKLQYDLAKTVLDIGKSQLELQKANLIATTAASDANIQMQKESLNAQKAQDSFNSAMLSNSRLVVENLALIAQNIKGIADGTGPIASGFDLARVSVDNLAKGILASLNGIKPTSFEGLLQISKVFQNIEDASTRTALSIKIFGRGAGPDLAEALHKGPEALIALMTGLKQTGLVVTDLEGKLGDTLHNAISQFTADLATAGVKLGLAFAPTLIENVKALDDALRSLTSSGALADFADTLAADFKAFVDGIKLIYNGIISIGEAIDKVFGNGTALGVFKDVLIGVGAFIVATILPAFIAWPILVTAVITALGYLSENWDKVSKAISDGVTYVTNLFKTGWQSTLDYVSNAFQAVLDYIKSTWLGQIIAAIAKAAAAIKSLFSSAPNDSSPSSSSSTDAAPQQSFAGGGLVQGPGTTKSDSVLIAASNKEFVVQAPSVERVGLAAMNYINIHGKIPGFAGGGLVSGRVASPSSSGGAQRQLHLTIGGQTFHGLSAPETIVPALRRAAVKTQLASNGRGPGWKS